MSDKLTVEQIAADLGYTPQHTNRKIREFCQAKKMNPVYFGSIKPGKGGGRQFTVKEVARLKEWLASPVKALEENEFDSPNSKPDVTVETGNHLTVLDSPDVLGSYSLEAIRGDVRTILFDNPLEIVNKLKVVASHLRAGFSQDYAVRLHQNAETLEATRMIEDEVRSLELEALKYQLRTEMVAASTNSSTKRLETAVNRFETLTKRKGGESDG